jgi:hypothetical protein
MPVKTERNTVSTRLGGSRDQGPFRSEQFVVRVGDQYAVKGGKLTASRELATRYSIRESAQREANSFRNAVVEKIPVFE